MTQNVLVVGYPNDTQTAHQIKKLRDFGAEVRLIPADLPPSATSFSWNNDSVVIDGKEIGAVDAALIRSLPPSYLDSNNFSQPLDWKSYFYQFCLQRDRSDTVMGFLLTLESMNVPCWNPPSRALLVRRKPYQLDTIRRLGCPVPETLITNNPAYAIDFLNRCVDVIVKPAAGGALTLNAAELPLEELERIRVCSCDISKKGEGR